MVEKSSKVPSSFEVDTNYVDKIIAKDIEQSSVSVNLDEN